MNITAHIEHSAADYAVTVSTEGASKAIPIPGKGDGQGSSVNGGELLFLALATCCCNDLYREAARRNMVLQQVTVTVSGAFGGEGEPASRIRYRVQVQSDHSDAEVQDLIRHVDRIAEIHNTLRQGLPVILEEEEAG